MLVDQDRTISQEIEHLGPPLTWVISVPGVMRGKGRPRFGKGFVYTDAKTANTETWVKSRAVEQCGTPCLSGAVSLLVDIEVPVPASWSKRDKALALAGSLRPKGKPDLDNCIKLIADALNGIMWVDDAQVVSMAVSKRYADAGNTVIKVSQV